MSPAIDRADKYYQETENSRTAAVMALFNQEDDILHLTLIRRATHPKDQHAGQISFPGGGLDEGETLIDCALRETEEETGVDVQNIHSIGALSPLYVFASDNMVHPFVGYYNGKPEFKPDPKEAAAIINIPLTYMMRPEIVSLTELTLRGHHLPHVPYYDVNGHVLWGATAMMMAELIHVCQEII